MKILLTCVLLTAFNTAIAQPFAIGSRTVTMTDPARGNRSIGCQIYYPAATAGSNVAVATGQFPVIVVGHGFSMSVAAYENWWTEFVPEGYIFVLPTTEVGPIPFPSHPDFGLDLAFAAAQMQTWNTDNASPFFGKVTDRTGLMGHSMGGGCSILAAANNPMVNCILGLAPAETNTSAIAAAANVTAPSLVLWGTEDEVTPEAGHALGIYNALASTCKNYVRIDQGAHCFFANYNFFCATGEMNIGTLTREEQQAVSYLLARPFFNFWLKDDCDGYDQLQNVMTTDPDLGPNILDCPNDAPVISEYSGTLESNVQPNYQWYLNGDPIANADQQQFTYVQPGTYQVGTVILGNCPTFSNEIVIQPTGLVEAEIRMMTLGDHVQLRTRDPLSNVTLEWFDLSGKVVATNTIGTVAANGSMVLDRPAFTGIKLLRLRSDEAVEVWKLF